MKAISVSLLLLILISSIVTITEVNASKLSDTADKAERLAEKTEDKLEDIADKMRPLGGQNNNYNDNDNENIPNEIDNSKDKENTFSKNNDNDKMSIADELRELVQLKKEGILTEEEFTEMKEDLIEEKK